MLPGWNIGSLGRVTSVYLGSFSPGSPFCPSGFLTTYVAHKKDESRFAIPGARAQGGLQRYK